MTRSAQATEPRRRFFIPEVVQISDLDCGPAALQCLLAGFGIRASYARLREACQTDLDGTSIDTLEEIAVSLGLDAEQIVVPVDHVLRAQAHALPCIAVVQLASGVTHFVVLWSAHGRFVQIMDPAGGRRWVPRRRVLDDLYVHTHRVPAADWREWAASDEFANTLRARLADLAGTGAGELALQAALDDPAWQPLAALDAAARLAASIVAGGGLARGREAAAAVAGLQQRALAEPGERCRAIPSWFWSVRPLSGDDGDADVNGGVMLGFKGAVLVRARGVRPAAASNADAAERSPGLTAALTAAPSHAGRDLLRLLRADRLFTPAALGAALALAALGIVIEVLLFRGLIDIGGELTLGGQRLTAMVALLVFGAALLALELPVATGLLRLGRRLEARLRLAFLEKLPKIGDRYLHSRLTSDMAERSHSIHRVRELPEMGGHLLRAAFELMLTVAGIAWLDPASTPFALLAAGVAVGLPLAVQPLLAERDLRVRSHAGALSRFYLDALLGLVAVRSHAAERAVRREHERLLVEWGRANVVQQRAVVVAEAAQLAAGFGLAWLLVSHLATRGEPAGFLLATYWALSLPALGEQIAMLARQYPDHRNVTLRLMEPLGVPDELDVGVVGPAASTSRRDPGEAARPVATDELDVGAVGAVAPASRGDPAEAAPLVAGLPGRRRELARGASAHGVSIELRDVEVRNAGQVIIERADLEIAAGQHVAVVGASGAGKSTLVGLLLGWHRPTRGRVQVDGGSLTSAVLERLRGETAWVDPAVHLWNRSLIENLRYGSALDGAVELGQAIETSDLRDLLMALPDGLQTSLGEGGALVSGGEGQRVRLARALLRSSVRLVILDEPFRGLARDQRRTLLARAREHWRAATLLCVTHDVAETRSFDQVVVIEHGVIVERGDPAEMSRTDTRYRRMLDAERAARQRLWSEPHWRRLMLAGGRLVAGGEAGRS